MHTWIVTITRTSLFVGMDVCSEAWNAKFGLSASVTGDAIYRFMYIELNLVNNNHKS